MKRRIGEVFVILQKPPPGRARGLYKEKNRI